MIKTPFAQAESVLLKGELSKPVEAAVSEVVKDSGALVTVVEPAKKMLVPIVATALGGAFLGLNEEKSKREDQHKRYAEEMETKRHEAEEQGRRERAEVMKQNSELQIKLEHERETAKQQHERDMAEKDQFYKNKQKEEDNRRHDRNLLIGGAVASFAMIGVMWVWKQINKPDYTLKIAELEKKIKHLQDNGGSEHVIYTLRRKVDEYSKYV